MTHSGMPDQDVARGGQMGQRVRALDWSTTPMGPIDTWPQHLRSAVGICLDSNFPIALYLGPAFTLIYNDAWIPVPGDKHPWALGRAAHEVWFEIWDIIEPNYKQVMSTGAAIFAKDALFFMRRHGYTEECYFDYTLSPIHGTDGAVDGIFNAAIETTYRVLDERRMRRLRELAQHIATARSAEAACALATETFGAAIEDVPFALLYLVQADGRQAGLAGTAGIARDTPACPLTINLDAADAGPWPLAAVAQTGTPQLVSDLPDHLGHLPGGAWPEPAEQALVLPIAATGQGGLAGFLIAGVSPRRALDDNYRSFFELAAGHIATAVANARAYQVERQRAEALAELDHAKTAFFSNVSHEFRTPLTLMLGPLEDLLTQGPIAHPAEIHESLTMVYRNSLRLMRLVNALLDFSRIEAGRVRADPNLRTVPVVLLSARADEEARVEGLEAGADDYLIKPFSARELLARVTTHVELVRLREAVERAAGREETLGLLASIVESSHDAIIGADLASRITTWNRGAEQTFGYPAAEALGRPIALLIPPDTADKEAHIIERISGGEIIDPFETEWKRKDGQQISVSLSVSPIRDGTGQVIGASWIARDMTEHQRATEALRQAEAKYRGIFENAGEGIFQTTPAGRIITANPTLARMLGYESPADLLAAITDVQTQLSVEPARRSELMRLLEEHGTVQHFEVEYYRKDRSRISVSINARTVRDDHGQVLYYEGMSTDITERKRTEEALRESEELYRLLTENSNDMISLLDLDGRRVYYSPSFSRLLGRGLPSSVTLSFERVHPEDREAVGRSWKAILTGEERLSTYRYQNADGDWRWLEAWGSLIQYQGKPHIMGVNRDITERKQAEQALRESEKVFRTTFELAAVGQAQGDPTTGHLLRVNRKLCESLGYSEEELLGMDFLQITHPDYREQDILMFQRMTSGEISDYTIEKRMIRKDGSNVWLRVAASVIRDAEGKPLRTVAIAEDITERKQAEEELRQHREHLEELVAERTTELAAAKAKAEDADRLKSAFLTSMSHDLRTPLNGILGYAQILLREGGLSPRQVDGLTIMQQSGEHLLALINDILDLAKIEAGKLDLVPTDVHFPTFLDGIVGIIRARAEQKGLTFRYAPDPPLPLGIRVDETRLCQVLLNLLGNAIKFTAHGSVTLRVSSELPDGEEETQNSKLKTQNSTTIRFEVIDTGVGINQGDLPRLFRPFAQLGEAQQRAAGTGLGLAISQRLVQRMGSAIQLDSQLGAGSTFWFDLRVPVVAADGAARALPDRAIIGYAGPQRAILVVDDSASNRRVLVDLLTPLGFAVAEAADGPTALRLAQAAPPDLIFMDLRLPGMTGMDVTQALRQIAVLKAVVIIATSASVSDRDRQQSLLAGCNAFVPKPIRIAQLFDLIATQLGLTWRYTEEERRAVGAVGIDDATRLTPPSPAELAVLFELATIGDLLGLQARAAQLAQGDVALRPFALRLARFASQFEAEQALALIARYR